MLFGTTFSYILLMTLLGLVFGMWKGRATAGALLGLFLGPVGLLILAFLPPKAAALGFGGFGSAGFRPALRRCPQCRRPVGRNDKACPHCGNLLIDVRYKVEE